MSEKDLGAQGCIYPLTNFESDVEKLDFGDGILLRRVSEEEKKMINSFSLMRGPLGRGLIDLHFVLEAKTRMMKTKEGVVFVPPLREVSNILLALRLFKQGFVDTPYEFYQDHAGAIFGCGYGHHLLRPPKTESYFLRTTETNDFLRLYRNLKRTIEDKTWIFSLVQFSKGYDQDSPSDRIVTFCTALESIFFYGEKEMKPAGRIIGIAVSMLLGKSQKERGEIKREIVTAFKLRNDIVHANIENLEKHASKLSNISDKAEEYLRKSLKKLVEEET